MLIKLLGNNGSFKIKTIDKDKVKIHPSDRYCLMVKHGEMVNLKDNSAVTGPIIEANQTIKIYPEIKDLAPHTFHGIVNFNPKILDLGCLVTSPGVIKPEVNDQVFLIVRTFKKLNLDEIDYLFHLYQIN